MIDLIIALIAMGSITVVSGVLTAKFVPRRPSIQTALISLAAIAAPLFIIFSSGQLFWALIVPYSGALVWANLAPLFTAIAAGCSLRINQIPPWRRRLTAVLLSSASLATLLWPFLNIVLRPPPAGGDLWVGPVALQTSDASCSPAAAATFLRAAGINVCEADMVDHCLTDAAGTPTLGLYRGVRMVAKQHFREVEAINTTVDDLLRQGSWPVLLMVKLPATGDFDAKYERSGWVPGAGHSVVALQRTSDGEILVADPATGLETWTRSDLDVLWRGNAIRFQKSLPEATTLANAAEISRWQRRQNVQFHRVAKK